MKCYTRIKYMLIALSLITIGLFIFAKIDTSIFIGSDFLRGFSEGFLSSALVTLGLLSLRAVFFTKGHFPDDKPHLFWMVGAASFAGYLALNAIADNSTTHNIPATVLLIQSLIYYGLFAGRSISKKYSFR